MGQANDDGQATRVRAKPQVNGATGVVGFPQQRTFQVRPYPHYGLHPTRLPKPGPGSGGNIRYGKSGGGRWVQAIPAAFSPHSVICQQAASVKRGSQLRCTVMTGGILADKSFSLRI